VLNVYFVNQIQQAHYTLTEVCVITAFIYSNYRHIRYMKV